MAIEIVTGTITTVTPATEEKSASCRIGEREIELHRDLADRVEAGDEVVVSGQADEKGMKALAINNRSQRRLSAIDSTNLMLLLGFCGFAWLLFFVLGMQNMMAGETMLTLLNLALSVIGLVGMGISFGRVFVIQRAANRIRNL